MHKNDSYKPFSHPLLVIRHTLKPIISFSSLACVDIPILQKQNVFFGSQIEQLGDHTEIQFIKPQTDTSVAERLFEIFML